jgi:glycosyltransferase involved in cell wall biosynthesis
MTTPATPTVGVVIPTHDRPGLVREALQSVLSQEVSAELDVVVVFDRNAPDQALTDFGTADRRVRVVANDRTPGLAGARNTGIHALTTEWVAFCDDDDAWVPGRLEAQLERSREVPEADVLTTAIRIVYEATEVARLVGRHEVGYTDLLRDRMAALHSSTFLIRRSALLGELGLVDEDIPGSQNEDWDLLLRAARIRPIQHVDEPLVRVRWGASSHFSRNWQIHVDALEWMLKRHPDLTTDDRGAARVYGQLAFGSAALGKRAAAVRWVGRAMRRRLTEPRAFIALAVATGVVAPEKVLALLNRRGKGL